MGVIVPVKVQRDQLRDVLAGNKMTTLEAAAHVATRTMARNASQRQRVDCVGQSDPVSGARMLPA